MYRIYQKCIPHRAHWKYLYQAVPTDINSILYHVPYLPAMQTTQGSLEYLHILSSVNRHKQHFVSCTAFTRNAYHTGLTGISILSSVNRYKYHFLTCIYYKCILHLVYSCQVYAFFKILNKNNMPESTYFFQQE